MARVSTIFYSVLYNSKNISEDISKSLISINYKDKVSGESDELEIVLEDKDGLWQNAWYPEKGAILTVTIGSDDGRRLECGRFQIDGIKFSGPPDIVAIKGLSTVIYKKLRTKNSYAHENKNLSEIIHSIAARLGFKVIGTIENVIIDRSTQYRETDLSYLKKLANEYGYNFTIKDQNLIFIKQFDLESRSTSLIVDKTECQAYDFEDKTFEVYNKAHFKSHNPNSNKVIEGSADSDLDSDTDEYSQNIDVLEVREKTESEGQAGTKAKARLHKKNSLQKTGRISLPGSALCISGNNIDLTGYGNFSGIYHIMESTHNVSRSGWVCDCEIKRVQKTSTPAKKIPKKVVLTKPVNYEVTFFRTTQNFNFNNTK